MPCSPLRRITLKTTINLSAMNRFHNPRNHPPVAGPDLAVVRAKMPDPILDRILSVVWLGLFLLTLGCATLVSAFAGRHPVSQHLSSATGASVASLVVAK